MEGSPHQSACCRHESTVLTETPESRQCVHLGKPLSHCSVHSMNFSLSILPQPFYGGIYLGIFTLFFLGLYLGSM